MNSPTDPQYRAPWIVALAASAGGLHALTEVLSPLPANLAAAVVVVMHLHPKHPSHLTEILARRTALHVQEAGEGDVPRAGIVYVALPDRHLLVDSEGTLTLADTQPVHFLRPSADILLQSVGAHYKNRAIAVILSGTGSDGSEGARDIKRQGGTVIAQDPVDAEFSGMPEAAINTGAVDRVLPLANIAGAILELIGGAE